MCWPSLAPAQSEVITARIVGVHDGDSITALAAGNQQIKGTALDEMFPEYMLDQIAAGKTRVNEQGQERFFPKYPRAMEDFTRRYDQATQTITDVVALTTHDDIHARKVDICLR